VTTRVLLAIYVIFCRVVLVLCVVLIGWPVDYFVEVVPFQGENTMEQRVPLMGLELGRNLI
jgi:hypothetical protein